MEQQQFERLPAPLDVPEARPGQQSVPCVPFHAPAARAVRMLIHRGAPGRGLHRPTLSPALRRPSAGQWPAKLRSLRSPRMSPVTSTASGAPMEVER